MRSYNFIVKPEDRCVVCIMNISDEYGQAQFSGVARCNPSDEFNEETGKFIAKRRALLKFKRAVCRIERKNLKRCQDMAARWTQNVATVQNRIDRMHITMAHLREEIDNYETVMANGVAE